MDRDDSTINRRDHIKRYQEIVTVFAKHGFGVLIEQLGIFRYLKIRKRFSNPGDNPGTRISTGERLKLSCEELGPTFIKIGQLLSTRSDIFPPDITEELEKLQDFVPPFPFEDVRALIEDEFEDHLEHIFQEFHQEPLAAASVSQVHYARLHAGKPVAVKVQRPGIEKNVELDLSILKDLAHFLDQHTHYGKMYDFHNMVRELENTLRDELNFMKEAENAETFRKNLRQDQGIKIPDIKWMYTTKRVLTMEYIQGSRITSFDELDTRGIDRTIVAKNLATSLFQQILRDGFFHADPHPGNILVLPDHTVVLLDLGMVGRLSEKRKTLFLNLFIGVGTGNTRKVIKAIAGLNTMNQRVGLKKFEKDMDILVDRYLTMPLNQIKVGEVLHEIFKLAMKYHVKIPQEFTLLAKTLATLQGVVEKLDPSLNVLDVIKPITNKLVYQTWSVPKIGHRAMRVLFDYQDLLSEFPVIMADFLKKVEDDDFSLQWEIKNMEQIQQRFDKVANRIVFSLVLLSLSIVIAGILIGSGISASSGAEMYLLNMTVLKIGFFLAILIIAGLVGSILKSKGF
ncbi:ABC1 kinase family protein [Candidatus Formimonas warabiya]|uniref:2-octaprenylphenol hydroxylase n=1 Tax=Formimonas warabiya TaxID=1761012 RepID=A0A3G1KVD1_FORW1|nr:AarF/UbiB family protein [Candidatus Formimonas warabiya]ATW26438.1 2-octaprenylphenol hydroxylase [Candidatus Formimonas warabiya]